MVETYPLARATRRTGASPRGMVLTLVLALTSLALAPPAIASAAGELLTGSVTDGTGPAVGVNVLLFPTPTFEPPFFTTTSGAGTYGFDVPLRHLPPRSLRRRLRIVRTGHHPRLVGAPGDRHRTRATGVGDGHRTTRPGRRHADRRHGAGRHVPWLPVGANHTHERRRHIQRHTGTGQQRPTRRHGTRLPVGHTPGVDQRQHRPRRHHRGRRTVRQHDLRRRQRRLWLRRHSPTNRHRTAHHRVLNGCHRRLPSPQRHRHVDGQRQRIRRGSTDGRHRCRHRSRRQPLGDGDSERPRRESPASTAPTG